TSEDEAIVNKYGDIYEVPPYLINVKPVIKIEGEIKAVGAPIGMAEEQEFIMIFIEPQGIDEVRNTITAGQYLGIGLNLQKIPKELIEKRVSKMKTVVDQIESSQNVDIDESMGEMFYLTALSYFCELGLLENVYAKYHNIVFFKRPGEAIVANNLQVSYLFSIPYSNLFVGSYIDVDREVFSVFSEDGDKNKPIIFLQAIGHMGSAIEHIIFEQLYNQSAISAVKAISFASQSGIPIYTINKTNIAKILPQLNVSFDVKSDIQNAVNTGKIVTIPKNNLQYYNWSGIGYIVSDPDTGGAAYMISGGIAGGSTVWKYIWKIAEYIFNFVPKVWASVVSIIMSIIDIFTSDAPGIVKFVAALLLLKAISWIVIGMLMNSILGFVICSILACLLLICIDIMLSSYEKKKKSGRSNLFIPIYSRLNFLKIANNFNYSLQKMVQPI
ncbi:MAG: hypothetical protein AB1297_06675, partial [bacterium]